ncbi:MAG: redoxin domain-containing protein [Candidatus Sulfotelmatobacter sp.]
MKRQKPAAADRVHWRRGVVGLLLLALALGCRSERSANALPDVEMPQVRGGTFRLRRQRQELVLLAFLQTVPDTADTPSRREVAFLLSMNHQYAARGLRAAIIDSSALVRNQQPTHEELINASYDWHLDIPLLEDRDNRIASRLSVLQLPTMILIASDGSISQRWQGVTAPAILAQGIEKQFGQQFGKVRKTP